MNVSSNHQKKRFRLLVFALLSFFTYWFYSLVDAYANRIATGYTDSAGFMEMISKKGLNLELRSVYFTSSIKVTSLYGESADRICELIPQSFSGSRSVITGHPYLISIPASMFSWISGLTPDYVAAILLSFTSTLAIVAIAAFLLKNGVSKTVCGFFIVMVMCYPVLTQSMLGQPYFDRLMLGPAVMTILLVWSTKQHSFSNWKWICVLTLVLALISERGAALGGLISCGYLLLLHGRRVIFVRELRFIFISGAISLAWLQIWGRYVQNLSAYNQISFGSWLPRIKSLLANPDSTGFKVFVLVSLSFIIFSIFSGRGILLLIVSFLPNVVLSTGGAELSGFLTHYHQVYLPVLLSFAAVGLVVISGRAGEFLASKSLSIQKGGRYLASTSMVLVLLISIGYPFNSVAPVFRGGVVEDAVAVWFPFVRTYDDDVANVRQSQSEVAEYISDLNPKDVSASEGLYPALLLSGIKGVEYWPFGVGTAEVVLAPHIGGLPNVLPYADPQGSTGNLQECVERVLENDYKLVRTFTGDLRVYLKN